MARMMLRAGEWYGWTMWPGYVGAPYHSPVRIQKVRPLGVGNGRFDLEFVNAAYASGVRDMTHQLRMLKREASYLLASVEECDRAVCVEPLDLAWLEKNMLGANLPFDLFRGFARDTASEQISTWLDQHYGG